MRYPSAVDQRVPSGRRPNNRSIIVIVIALDLLLELVVLGFDLDLAAAVPELVLPLAATPAGAVAVRAFDLFLVLVVFGLDLDPARAVPVLILPLAVLMPTAPVIGGYRRHNGQAKRRHSPHAKHGLRSHLTTSAIKDASGRLAVAFVRRSARQPAGLSIRQRAGLALSVRRAGIGECRGGAPCRGRPPCRSSSVTPPGRLLPGS